MSTNLRTPLQIAAKEGNLGEVQLLLESGAFVNDVIQDEKSPLFHACEGGHLEIAQLLVYNGASMTCKSVPPLEIAAQRGHLEVVSLLLENGAEVDSMPNNATPLRRACHRGHVEVARLLIEQFGANVNGIVGKRHGAVPLYIAVKRRNMAVAKLLLDNNANVHHKTKRSHQPIHAAFRNGHMEMVKLLMEYGADADACTCNFCNGPVWTHPEKLGCLLKAGVHFDFAYCERALYYALQRPGLDVVELLILQHPQLVVSSPDLLLRVTASTDVRSYHIMHFMISQCANVNFKSIESRTALHMALLQSDMNKVWLLAVNGAEFIPHLSEERGKRTVWELCNGDKSLHEALLHMWTPDSHKHHPLWVKKAITCTLLVAKRQKWPFDLQLLWNILSFVAYGWYKRPGF